MKTIDYTGAQDGLFFWRCGKCKNERIVWPPIMPQTDRCPREEKKGAGPCGGEYTAHVLRSGSSTR